MAKTITVEEFEARKLAGDPCFEGGVWSGKSVQTEREAVLRDPSLNGGLPFAQECQDIVTNGISRAAREGALDLPPVDADSPVSQEKPVEVKVETPAPAAESVKAEPVVSSPPIAEPAPEVINENPSADQATDGGDPKEGGSDPQAAGAGDPEAPKPARRTGVKLG